MSDARDLTTGPVWQNLLRLALPMVVGILSVLSISLVDTYFVGQLGTQPLAALSFTFPVTLTVTSLAIGLGAGAASVVSRAIGAGERGEARRLATDSLALGVLVVVLVSVAGWLGIRPLFGLLGAEGAVLDDIERYMRIWYLSMPFLVVPMVGNAVIRAAGDAFWPSAVMVGAAALNVVLTPMLVFGWGPLPALAIEGAAWASLVARAGTLVFALGVLAFRERLLALSLPSLAELRASWARVVGIGVPAALGNMTNPLAVGVVTGILATFGDAVVAGFGAATRVESFVAVPMLALSSAIGPLTGQNWGAGRRERVVQALRLSFAICVGWSLVVAAVLWFAGGAVAALFSDDPAVQAETAAYLRIVPLGLWGYGLVIVAAGAFNALGRATTGLGFYLVRAFALYVPLAWLGARLGGSAEVFIGISVANAVGGTLVAVAALWLLRAQAPGAPEADGVAAARA